MPNIADANIAAIRLAEQGSDYATPAAGFWRIYFKAAGMFIIDDAGTVMGPLNTIAGLDDLDLTTPADKMYLKYDSGTSKWVDDYVRELYLVNDLIAATFNSGSETGLLIDVTTAWGALRLDGTSGGLLSLMDDGVLIGSLEGDGPNGEVLLAAASAGIDAGIGVVGAGSVLFLRWDGTNIVTIEDNVRAIVNRALNVLPAAGDIGTPQNGDIWYDSTAGKFRARQAGSSVDLIGGGGGGALDDLTDVTITTPATGAVLQYDGAGWIDAVLAKLVGGNVEAEAASDYLRVTGTGATASVDANGTDGGSFRMYDNGVLLATLGAGTIAGIVELEGASGFDFYFTTGDAADIFRFYNGATLAMQLEDDLATFNRSILLTPTAGNPTPSDGQMWYNDTTGKLMAREEGTSYEVISRPADVGIFVQGLPSNSELVLRLEVPRAFTIPSGGTGSQASARVASTGNVAFDLLKNGVSFGTVTFNVSATGSFTVASATSFAAGDVLTITAPATADATLEDISITLVGTRD